MFLPNCNPPGGFQMAGATMSLLSCHRERRCCPWASMALFQVLSQGHNGLSGPIPVPNGKLLGYSLTQIQRDLALIENL